MSTAYWEGSLSLISSFVNLALSGLYQASSQGGGMGER